MRYMPLEIRRGTPAPLFGIHPEGNPAAPSVGTAQGEEYARLFAASPDMLKAIEKVLDECPFQCSEDSCECGENGNGFDDKGNPCEHILVYRAWAKAKGK